MVGPSSKMDAWCGLALDTRSNTLWSLANGGHSNYRGNEVMKFELGADAPHWVEMLASTASPAPLELPRYSDGRPASCHTYSSHQFIERHNRAMRVGAQAVAGANAPSFWDVDGYDCTAPAGTNGWAAQYTYDSILPATGIAGSNAWPTVKNPTTEEIYVFINNNYVRKMTPASSGIGGKWVNVHAGAIPVSFYNGTAAYDTARNRIFVLHGGYVTCDSCHTFDTATGLFTAQTLTGGTPKSELDAAKGCLGLVYVPQLDAYLARVRGAGAKVYRIDAGTFAVTALATTGGAAVPAGAFIDDTQYENIYNRWLFVPSLQGIVYFPSYNANAWFLRTH